MGWLVRKRRVMSCRDQTLDSISAPPWPLMVFVGIVMILMYFEIYLDFKERVERSKMGFKFGLMMLPVVGIVVVNMMLLLRRWWRNIVGVSRRPAVVEREEGSWPWGLMLVLGLLLVMVYYQKSFQSACFRL